MGGRGLPSVKVAVGTETIRVPATTAATKAAHFSPTNPVSSSQSRVNTMTQDIADTQDAAEDSDTEARDVDINEFRRTLRILERRRSTRNAATNGAIAVVVVPSLLAALSWHQRLGGGNLWKIKAHLKA